MFKPDRPAATVLLFGKWGPPFLTCARSCAAWNCSVHFLEAGATEPQWQRYSKHLSGGGCLDEHLIGTDEGAATIYRYARSIGATAVVPLSEAHLLWLSRYRAEWEPVCRLLTSPMRTLNSLASKVDQAELAAQVGFPILTTWVVTAPADVDAIPEHSYPVVVRPDRPYISDPGLKVRHFSTAAELRQFIAALPRFEHPLVVQPFRNWPNLLVHGVRAEDGRVLAVRSFLAYRKFKGVALSLREIPFPPNVEEACRAFAAAAGVVGCFHFDLLYSEKEERAYYLEINPRLGGTTDKVARFGYDEPALMLAAFGYPVRVEAPHRTSLRAVANRRALAKHFLDALRGRLSELDYPAAGRLRHCWRSCLECLTTKDSVFDWSDLRGSLWFYLRI